MPSTNQIPVYLEGDSVGFAAPLRVLNRAELRQLKKEGKGYFVSHGHAFVLYRAAAAETELRELISGTLQTPAKQVSLLRDESANIQPPTMDDYVDGRRAARVAVDSWATGEPRCGSGR